MNFLDGAGKSVSDILKDLSRIFNQAVISQVHANLIDMIFCSIHLSAEMSHFLPLVIAVRWVYFLLNLPVQ